MYINLHLLFTAYSPSRYSLPFPEVLKESLDHDFKLWTPPSLKHILDNLPHQTTPAHIKDIVGTAGVPTAKFWDMWELCYGCDFIILSSKMKDHGCDLTAND